SSGILLSPGSAGIKSLIGFVMTGKQYLVQVYAIKGGRLTVVCIDTGACVCNTKTSRFSVSRSAVQKVQGTLRSLPKWRNWQTRMVQVHVFARMWGFESPLRHQEFHSDEHPLRMLIFLPLAPRPSSRTQTVHLWPRGQGAVRLPVAWLFCCRARRLARAGAPSGSAFRSR